jgi:hypothetical protein
MNIKLMTDEEKLQFVENELNKLPFFAHAVSNHISMQITHPDPEVTQISYRIVSSLRDKAGMPTKIFQEITRVATKVNIPIVVDDTL